MTHPVPADVWKAIPKWDRPPRRFKRIITERHPQGWDTSADRPKVECRLPGKPIADLKDLHTGRCAILFNGASLGLHDLHAVRSARIPIIGMNRTYVGFKGYTGPQPDYYCFIDWCWTDNAKRITDAVVINGSTDKRDVGYRIARSFRMRPFSFDLVRDGFVPPVPCTTGHMALQVAVHLGFTELYCLGLDMGGPHMDGSRASLQMESANRYLQKMAPVLKERGIAVYVCGSPDSKCTAFEHRTFDDLVRVS